MGDPITSAPPDTTVPAPKLAAGLNEKPPTTPRPQHAHPSGKESHGRGIQILRALAFTVYFTTCSLVINGSQFLGAPLYWFNREWFYAYMSMTKRYFAIVIISMTSIWGPTTIRISGDDSVAGQIRQTEGGNVEFNFPERMIMIANHQIYTDWLYLWWVGYANRLRMDGHIFIILKESLKHIPIIGWGMQFYGFIFMSRKMATDRPRMAHRLNKLKEKKTDPSGRTYLDPMWLLLFPEGTNLSGNGRRKSKAWADKNGLRDPEHVMIPRSTGLFFCLTELKGSIDYVYDCTVAYEGIARGKYGEEIFGLSSTYFEGRAPRSVNFYWRRFRVADIPLGSVEELDQWLKDEWYKKDALMEEYLTTGRFPPGGVTPAGAAKVGGEKTKAQLAYIETQVRTKRPWEILQVFTVVGLAGLIWSNLVKVWRAFVGVLRW